MADYLIFFALVLGINLMPAFGPPTWSIIALYALNGDLKLALLVIVGALAAALGRFLLGHATRLFGERFLTERIQANLEAAREALEQRRRNTVLALGLFALSPVPSAQLFEAAGLARLPLLPFTAAFFAGRIVSYTIYGLTAAGLASTSLGEAFREQFSSPLGIALQVAMLVGLVLLARVDWAKRFGRERGGA
ncbi:VTT domain-containing protein [Erythrobacter sp. HKB08]|uniref:VTT domain-containing protein n=1 Tax=Erythrobacter sp. HKB08 TaxID=2502843 RepID=UPI0010093562|nr:VTT domain-containing protein [Erythrobacter sp. HKB08]